MPQFDMARYKAERLKSEQWDCMLMIEAIRSHLHPRR